MSRTPSASHRGPFLIAPDGLALDAETAITLIETVIGLYRRGQDQSEVQTSSMITPQSVLERGTHPPRRPAVPFRSNDGSGAAATVHEPRSRNVYSIRVHDGASLQAKTQAEISVADFIRKHPRVSTDDISHSTGLKKTTIMNILTAFRKQSVLVTEPGSSTTTRARA